AEDAVHVADLGSGAGFPGLVLALMARDAGRSSMFHLVESDSRKAAFLIEAALALKLFNHNVRVHAVRLEKMGEGRIAGTMDIAVARALAALPDLLAHAMPMLVPGGTCLFLKGTKAEDEIAAARRAGWRFELTRHASRVAGGGALLEISKLAREAPLAAWPLRKL
ncbi:MAG: 16S rRNA (guanine(527)-N(7))-methyltransferase RsmG, partial [Alphaproteobacteria bacterium]|nr:16S rRNA (guanine(527)-N(7))-methyltransferase RsmG [Alphaproteobacteria bacterium]